MILGGKSGATAVDAALYALMLQRFGAAFDNLPKRRTGFDSVFMKTFEQFKRNFDGKEDKAQIFELPLKMSLLSPDDVEMHKYYDFEADVVKLSW